jgi:predicted dehydrogenase
MKTSKTDIISRITRREFIGAAASAAALTIVTRHVLGGSGTRPPSEKLNIACIGVGGKGFDNNVRNVSTENIVALCDVDTKRAADAFEMFPEAKRYGDFRRLLEGERKNIDAVVVSTPDHVHIPASVMAMKLGKHVYCEKPLGQNIHEIRLATKVARESGVATQMGNGAHSGYNYRSVVALVKAGTIGEIKEVHAWCDNEWDTPPRVVADDGSLPWGDRQPQETPPVPEHLRWDLWLGPAPVRPYHPAYHPVSWRGWWDFGNGRLGDMGCHLIDLPFSALDLKYPLTVETEGPRRVGRQVAPRWLISRWTFPRRGDLPPVELTWYDGNKQPELLKEVNPPDSNWPWYVLFVGSKGMLIAGMNTFKLYPEDKFADVRRPQLSPRAIHHAQEWIAACKTGSPTGCHFGYSGPLTETVLLGTVAYRAGRKLEWDAESMKVTNCPEANRFVRREYREGWTL